MVTLIKLLVAVIKFFIMVTKFGFLDEVLSNLEALLPETDAEA